MREVRAVYSETPPSRRITPEQAEIVYTLLVRLAGASFDPWERQAFIRHVAHRKPPCSLYRFGGYLGAGGKFVNDGGNEDVPYVMCYPEDESPKRLNLIAHVNKELKLIFSP